VNDGDDPRVPVLDAGFSFMGASVTPSRLKMLKPISFPPGSLSSGLRGFFFLPPFNLIHYFKFPPSGLTCLGKGAREWTRAFNPLPPIYPQVFDRFLAPSLPHM